MKYPNYIMESVRKNLGLKENDTTQDEYINKISKKKVLDKYLEWNGLIGYAGTVLEVVGDIYDIELDGEGVNE